MKKQYTSPETRLVKMEVEMLQGTSNLRISGERTVDSESDIQSDFDDNLWDEDD